MTYNSLSLLACSSIGYGFWKYGRRATKSSTTPMLPVRYWNVGSIPFRTLALVCHTIGLIGISQIFPKFQIPLTFTFDHDPNEYSLSTNPNAFATSTGTGAGVNNELTNDNSKFPEISKNDSVNMIDNDEKIRRTINFRAQCPIDFKYEKDSAKKNDESIIYGMKRVSRHSTLWSLGIFALGSSLRTRMVPSVIMFTMPIIFAAIGSTHIDYRYRRGNGGLLTPEMENETSNIPFVALMTGKQNWNDLKNEMKDVNAGIACAIAFYVNMFYAAV